MRLIDADKLIITRYDYEGALTLKQRLQRLAATQPTVEDIPIEWLENFTNNYCDLAAAIDTQFFINEFILKR